MAEYNNTAGTNEGIWLRNRVVPRQMPGVEEAGEIGSLEVSQSLHLEPALNEYEESVYDSPKESHTGEDGELREELGDSNREPPRTARSNGHVQLDIEVTSGNMQHIPISTVAGTAATLGTRANNRTMATPTRSGIGATLGSPSTSSPIVRPSGASSYVNTTSTARRTMITVPPRFDGTNVREWLVQVSLYYDQMGLWGRERIDDVVALLSGKALSYWCSIVENDNKFYPTSWESFKQLMTQRFGGKSTATTLARLRELEYEGNFEQLSEAFAEILADGDPLPPQTALRLYLSRFPMEMLRAVACEEFESWVDAREKIRQEINARQQWAVDWYNEATPKQRREALRNAQFVGEGWFPQELVQAERQRMRREMEGPPRMGPNGMNSRNNFKPGLPRFNAMNKGNSRCYQCNGVGHLARDCPNVHQAAKRDGQRCHKCGGMGHWASACPTSGKQGNVERGPGQFKRESQSGYRNQGNGRA